MKVAFISHSDCKLHENSSMHPEAPARLSAIEDRLIASGLEMWLQHYTAKKITAEKLAYIHSQNYINKVFQIDKEIQQQYTRVFLDGGDTGMNEYSLDAALYAAGSTIQAVDLIMNKTVDKAFCNTRPPGHHAEPDHAMGFCIFNNIALGAAYALEHYNLSRIAIIDFDVHHGNGTESAFAGNDKVLFISTFQHPFYPMRGIPPQADNIINIPLPSGTHGEHFRKAMEEQAFPKIAEFKPEMLFVSAGFDGHRSDDLAQWLLTEADYAWIGERIAKLAKVYCEERVIAVLEGGYNLEALAISAYEFLAALALEE